MLIKNWHNFNFKAKLVTNRSNVKKKAISLKFDLSQNFIRQPTMCGFSLICYVKNNLQKRNILRNNVYNFRKKILILMLKISLPLI